MTATDKMHAHSLGVLVDVCPYCETRKSMDDFHEIQKDRLVEQIQERVKRESHLASDLFQAIIVRERWELIAFSGWALAVMLAIGDIFRWGRT